MSFDMKYQKQLKLNNYTKPDPIFDAWMCVLGKKRDQVEPKRMVKHYPGVTQNIKEIRKYVASVHP